MPTAAPPKVLVLVTAMPVPTLAEAKVPVPFSVTVSAPTNPDKVPVIVALVFPL